MIKGIILRTAPVNLVKFSLHVINRSNPLMRRISLKPNNSELKQGEEKLTVSIVFLTESSVNSSLEILWSSPVSNLKKKKLCLIFTFFKVSKPFERLVVFKELSEGSEENSKLFEFQKVVAMLTITLHI